MTVLAGVGLVSGFLAGFLGIGGGVVVVPALMYVAGMDVKLAMGISMVLATFAALSGLLVHRHSGTVNVRLGFVLGLAGVIGALAGSFGSAYIGGETLLAIYLCLVGASILLLFCAPKEGGSWDAKVSLAAAFPLGLIVGILAGMLGVGGGFVIVPLMISLLRVPTRVAVGTSLLVILPTTISGSVGKVATGQFNLEMGSLVVICGILGAQFGAKANAKVSPRTIRVTLILLLLAILVRTGVDLLGPSVGVPGP